MKGSSSWLIALLVPKPKLDPQALDTPFIWIAGIKVQNPRDTQTLSITTRFNLELTSSFACMPAVARRLLMEFTKIVPTLTKYSSQADCARIHIGAILGTCSKFLLWDLAKFSQKCNPFASSFAKLSRSLFSHVAQLGVSTWIPTFETPNCMFGPSYGCYPKLLHGRMTSPWKSQIPFANTIASFRENMIQAMNS